MPRFLLPATFSATGLGPCNQAWMHPYREISRLFRCADIRSTCGKFTRWGRNVSRPLDPNGPNMPCGPFKNQNHLNAVAKSDGKSKSWSLAQRLRNRMGERGLAALPRTRQAGRREHVSSLVNRDSAI